MLCVECSIYIFLPQDRIASVCVCVQTYLGNKSLYDRIFFSSSSSLSFPPFFYFGFPQKITLNKFIIKTTGPMLLRMYAVLEIYGYIHKQDISNGYIYNLSRQSDDYGTQSGLLMATRCAVCAYIIIGISQIFLFFSLGKMNMNINLSSPFLISSLSINLPPM